MAKTVKEFGISLKLLNTDALKKLSGSFRDLEKVLDITDNELKGLRQEILQFNKAGQQSEQLIKGQIQALKGLQSQATINSKTYSQLESDVEGLKAKLSGTTVAISKQRDAIIKNTTAQKLSAATVSKYIDQLRKLKSQTVENSKASKEFEQDIVSLTQKMRELKRQEIAQLGKGVTDFSKGATNNLGRLINRLGELGKASRTALGAWTRTVEGIGAAGAVGVAAKGVSGAGLMATGAAQGASGGLLNYLISSKESLSGLPLLGDKLANLIPDAAINKVAELTSSIAGLDGQLDAVNQAAAGVTSTLGQLGPAGAAAGVAAGTGIAFIFDLIKKRSDKAKAELDSVIQSIDDNVQRTLQSLARLENQMSGSRIAGLLGQARAGFAATPAGSYRSRSMASQIAGLEALGVQEAAAQADVLEHYRQRVRGTREDAQALGDRLAYVQGKLKTLDQTTEEGRAEFAQYSNEAISLTDKLNRLADGYRHVSTMATQAATAQQNAANAATRLNYFNFGAAQAQRQAMAELGQRVRAGVAGTPLALPAAGQTTAPGTGQAISGGARQFRGAVETTFDDPNFRRARTRGIRAGYYSPTTADVGQPAAVGMSEAAIRSQAGAAKKAAVDLTEYRTAIRLARQANTGSISSTNNLRQALVAMREQLDPTSNKFRALTRQIERLDAQSAKYALNQQKRGGLSGRNIRAAAGGALSGAVFGGPEGFIGGGLGGIIGGVPGAAAGAAAGAQVSMLRESLGEMAKYAAQLEKMRIALRGVTESQAEYQKALSISDRVGSRFNVSQAESITGMTRLTAAVTGAGGKVYDAGLVFENITAAIKATGGSTEDVNSAITAMVQVFSKGKVSAEELSGQLGERLPGAVTLFAEANKMSLVELQDALKAGTVGLNELMKFVVELGDKYKGTADEIAKSPAEAGARLKRLVDDLRAELGKALAPIGAELQNAFGRFIAENKDDIVAFAKSTAEAFQNLLRILKQYGPAIAVVLKFAAVTAVLRALSPVISGIGVGFKVTAASMGLFNKTSFATLRQMVALKKAAMGLRAVAGNIVFAVSIVGAELVINYFNRIKRAREGATEALKGKRGAEYLTSIGGSDLDRASIKQYIADEEEKRQKAQEAISKLRKAIPLEEQIKFGQRKDPLKPEGFSGSYGVAGPYEAQLQELYQAEQDLNLAANRVRTLQVELAGKPKAQTTNFASPKGEDDDKGGKGKVLMTQQELLLRRQIREAALKENELAKAVATYRLDVLEANKETKDVVAKQNMLEEANLKFQQSLLEYKKQQVEKAKELAKINADITYDFRQRQYELGLIGKEEFVQLELAREEADLREKLKDMPAAQREVMVTKGVELKRREIDPTFKEAAETDLALMQRQLEKMVEPLEMLKGAADAFGSSLTNAFNSVITGQASVKTALAGFLKDLGQYFLEYTAKVITQMIVIATIQAAIKALGGPSTGGASEAKPPLPGSVATIAAQGTVLNKGVKRYAMGGVVNKPTMFTYAEGGTGRFGLMGEAGPEAIIPLKRGNDGRLGVSAYFADANAAMAKGAANRTSAAAFEENADALAMSTSYVRERSQERERQTMLTGAGGSMLIQTQVINNVEYATMDQVAQASAASAKQARAEIFADMRNKPSVRSSLGMR